MTGTALILAVALVPAAQEVPPQGLPRQQQRELLREKDPDRRNEMVLDRGRVRLEELSRTAAPPRRASARTFAASVLVTNRSRKTIKSVSWLVSLLDSGKVIRSYDVTTEKRIAPGKTKRLSERLPVPVLRVVSVSAPGLVADVATKVTRVEYTDGSFSDSP
jgi:hypothetical protein